MRLLQRLASQARGGDGARIRSTAVMRAQVPIALPAAEPRASADVPAASALVPPPAEPPRIDGAFPSEMVRREPSDETVERLVREHMVRSPDDGPAPAAVASMVRRVVAPPLRSSLPTSDDALLEPEQPPLLGEIVSATPVTTASGAIHPVMSAERVTRSADTTEVHVHIGRIEVTALQSPPSASSKRRERAAPQTMPLSEYLAKRRPV